MRRALVVTGLLREYEQALDSWKRFLLPSFGIEQDDIYVSVWSDIGYWAPGDSLYAKGFIPSRRVASSHLQRVYGTAHVEVEDFDAREDQFESYLSPIPERFIPELQHSNYFVRGKNLVSMLWRIQQGLRALNLDDYDEVVRIRPDLILEDHVRPVTRLRAFRSLEQRGPFGKGIGDKIHYGRSRDFRPFLTVYDDLEALFWECDGLLCPHLLCERVLKRNGIKHKDWRLKARILHTPAGEYQVRTANSGTQWVHVDQAAYDKIPGRFAGACGESTSPVTD